MRSPTTSPSAATAACTPSATFATTVTGTNVDFDPGAGVYNLTSIGPKDVFVSKLDADGNFVWAKRVGGTGWSQGMTIGSGIAVAADGSVYTTGSFQGIADFDPGANQFTLTCQGDTDAFLSKLTSDGQFVWAKRIGNSTEDYGADLAVSRLDGSVYLTGGFQGVVDFDPGSAIFNLDSGSNRLLFAAKFTSAGQFVWADGFGGNGWNLAGDIALDAAGNAYVTGGFWGIASFDTGAGTYTISSLGEKDAFVLKLNSAGGFVWAARSGGTGDDSGNGIAVSTSGAIYTTGYFTGTADFDPSSALYQSDQRGRAGRLPRQIHAPFGSGHPRPGSDRPGLRRSDRVPRGVHRPGQRFRLRRRDPRRHRPRGLRPIGEPGRRHERHDL